MKNLDETCRVHGSFCWNWTGVNGLTRKCYGATCSLALGEAYQDAAQLISDGG
jgi:hypothetical protein